MKEENNTPKNKWSRIFRKKWFFPAVYLTIAALLLSMVVWYQNLGNQIDESQEENTEEYSPVEHGEEAQPVMDQQEVVQKPVESMDQAEIVTKYYDYNAEQEAQENAIVVFNDRYYQSTGIDIASADGETFDVLASLSGKVTEIKEDPLLGNVVTLKHENDVTTHYASLGDVKVSADQKVKQGETLGSAGKNLFGKDNGTHLHFEIRKDGNAVNPEDFFNQPLSALDKAAADNEKAQGDEGSKTDGSEHKSEQPDASNQETSESDSEDSEENSDSEGTEEEGSGSDGSDNAEDSGSGSSDSDTPESGASEDSNQDDTSNGATQQGTE
ncbi:stage II sporulation protein Q [Lentibacillus kapialis]|uniref:Stage II sporulation protein Q n=1 Tax=Lentibacillus kapialis TaxID=340214 RepID=A0A917UWY6_9BACI|nr:M23 family metallopeptidase [Lentibacillus kapialis]GGJ91724.1 stage II sporulation protein Q [Lentibacillus kapialis]